MEKREVELTEFIGICLGGKADGYEMRGYAPFARFAALGRLPDVFAPCVTAHEVPAEEDDYHFEELRGVSPGPAGVKLGVWVPGGRWDASGRAAYLALAELARDARRHRASRK